MAAAGECGPLWLVAGEQSGGRGRRGRTWVSQKGNLFATLLTKASLPAAAQLSFAAGIAVAETLDTYEPERDIRLKWPNDVLLRGRKISGILLESCGVELVAIGIGINLAHHPSGTEFPASSVSAETGVAPDAEDVLARLASRMAAWYEIWRSQGFGPVRSEWLSRAEGLGSDIKVRMANWDMIGRFEDIDQQGALVLRDAGGTLVRVTAGDVFFTA